LRFFLPDFFAIFPITRATATLGMHNKGAFKGEVINEAKGKQGKEIAARIRGEAGLSLGSRGHLINGIR
jgi:hypothetical protein